MRLNVQLTINLAFIIAPYWVFRALQRRHPPPVDNVRRHAEAIEEQKAKCSNK